MIAKRIPAKVFPVGYYIQEELDERGWTVAHLAVLMGGNTVWKVAADQMSIKLLLVDPESLLSKDIAGKLGQAFEGKRGRTPLVSTRELWLNLDKSYREWKTK